MNRFEKRMDGVKCCGRLAKIWSEVVSKDARRAGPSGLSDRLKDNVPSMTRPLL